MSNQPASAGRSQPQQTVKDPAATKPLDSCLKNRPDQCNQQASNTRPGTRQPPSTVLKYPALVAAARAAAEAATRAAKAAADYADQIQAIDPQDEALVRKAAELASAARLGEQDAAKTARALSEACCKPLHTDAAQRRPAEQKQRLSGAGQAAAPDNKDLQRQLNYIGAYQRLLLQCLEDPDGLHRGPTAHMYKDMHKAGTAAEWAFLHQHYSRRARLSRLLRELRGDRHSDLSYIQASLRELLPHALSNMPWLLRPWAAMQAEAHALTQDLLSDEQQPQPRDLNAATAKAHALRQLYISFRIQAILAAPSRYLELKVAASKLTWWQRAEGKAFLAAWQQQHSMPGQARALAAASEAAAQHETPDAKPVPDAASAGSGSHSKVPSMTERLLNHSRRLFSRRNPSTCSRSSSQTISSAQNSVDEPVWMQQAHACKPLHAASLQLLGTTAGEPAAAASQPGDSRASSPHSPGSSAMSAVCAQSACSMPGQFHDGQSPAGKFSKLPRLFRFSPVRQHHAGAQDAVPNSAGGCQHGLESMGPGSGVHTAPVASSVRGLSGPAPVTATSIRRARSLQVAPRRGTSPSRLGSRKNSPSPSSSEPEVSPRLSKASYFSKQQAADGRVSPFACTVTAGAPGLQVPVEPAAQPAASPVLSTRSLPEVSTARMYSLGGTTAPAEEASALASPTSPRERSALASPTSPRERFPGRSSTSVSRLGVPQLSASASDLQDFSEQHCSRHTSATGPPSPPVRHGKSVSFSIARAAHNMQGAPPPSSCVVRSVSHTSGSRSTAC